MTTMTESETLGNGLFGGMTNRVIAALMGLLALLLFMALLSYSPADPSFLNATSADASNWLGGPGAQMAALLLLTIGRTAALIPVVLGIWAIRLWTGSWDRMVVVPLRLIGAGLAAVIATSAFLSALPGRIEGLLGHGGWLGDFTIRPFAQGLAALDFSAPYQIPGLIFCLLAIVTIALACGVTREEAEWFRQHITASFRQVFSRENRVAVTETTLSRTRDLTRRLRPVKGAENPPTLEGTAMPVQAPLRAPPPVSEEPVSTAPPLKADRSADIVEEPVETKGQARRKAVMKRRKAAGGGIKPSLDLLAKAPRGVRHATKQELRAKSDTLMKVLEDYGVKGEIIDEKQGPVVTLHELEPAAGTKAARVVGLSDDIARSMSALSARVAPVRGRSVIGIEMPNEHREMVHLREILDKVVESDMQLPLALGKAIDGSIKFASLTKMPHLLVAGTTGAGKSVAINAMILSLLYRHTPEECRLIMIDPKMLELSVYDGIPHLLSPVVTDPKKAVMALKWVVREMESRYQKMAQMNVRGIEGYNLKMRAAQQAGEKLSRDKLDEFGNVSTEKYDPETLPFIVVVVDEMADLMMVAGKEIEACIQRLAQMARASGIHIIMATQRPSVDVITGTIKANFPTRISFQVTSKIDSRTILGEQGAEQLLGQGDMLYMAGGGRVTRVHGPFVSDGEVQRVADELRAHGEAGDQVSFDEPEGGNGEIDELLGLGGGDTDDQTLYDQAVAIVAHDRRATISYIQRRLQIGYNRAARLIEQMEEQGIVTPANNAGKREILIEAR